MRQSKSSTTYFHFIVSTIYNVNTLRIDNIINLLYVHHESCFSSIQRIDFAKDAAHQFVIMTITLHIHIVLLHVLYVFPQSRWTHTHTHTRNQINCRLLKAIWAQHIIWLLIDLTKITSSKFVYTFRFDKCRSLSHQNRPSEK